MGLRGPLSEEKGSPEELAARGPWYLRHLTDGGNCKAPKQLPCRACQEARCCFWKSVFPGRASGFRAFHLKRRIKVVKTEALLPLKKKSSLSKCTYMLMHTHTHTHTACMNVDMEHVFKKSS